MKKPITVVPAAPTVVPAKAGTQNFEKLDPRFRGGDKGMRP